MSTPTSPATRFRYFVEDPNGYAVKNKKWGAIVFALFFAGLGISIVLIPNNTTAGAILMMLFMFLLAFIFINAAFTKLLFNPSEQTVERTGLIASFNKKYHYREFDHIKTVRHSMNFIYIRTAVTLYFNVPLKKLLQPLDVGSVRTRRQLEQFLQELSEVMPVIK